MKEVNIIGSTCIKGFDAYIVYSSGEIFSFKSEKYLKPSRDTGGYYKVDLWRDGKRYTRLVARLVAETFIPNPENKPEINHKDGNKANNDKSNLEWATPKENQRHAVVNGLRKKTMVPVRVYDYGSGEFMSGHPSMKHAEEHYNLNIGDVSKCVNGIYNHVKGLKFVKAIVFY